MSLFITSKKLLEQLVVVSDFSENLVLQKAVTVTGVFWFWVFLGFVAVPSSNLFVSLV